MFKKILSLLLTFLLILTLVACDRTPPDSPPSGDPTDPSNPTDDAEELPLNSGTIEGTDIIWEVYLDRTLYIKGTGALPDYDIPNDQPWYEHGGNTSIDRSDKEGGSRLVTKIVIGEGITELSENAFSDFRPLTTVVLPSTLRTIPYKCFFDCPNLKEVVGGTGVVTIEASAFRYCGSLERIVLSDALATVEESAFGDIIPTNTNRRLSLNISGTQAAWQAALPAMDIHADNAAFQNATVTFFETE
ncbi:MAG: leucine-rich repeat domain-containing protein [Ruminococcaceae bacterium]|nr:leucine-rich repeat domain-containing protein [Oscillospiraceae bacterium]